MLFYCKPFKKLNSFISLLYLPIFTMVFITYSSNYSAGVVGKIARVSKEEPVIQKTTIQKPFKKSDSKIILFVWDGLRPDVITEENTPNLYKLKKQGSFFSDHHSSYPTITMNNANSLATGNYSGSTGFYGNRVWRPDMLEVGDASDTSLDFMQPVYTQQHMVLASLDKAKNGKPLMYVDTLLQVARKYGLKTAQIGKPGPLAIQDAHRPSSNGVILTDNKVYPLSFAKKLRKKGYALPYKAVDLYSEQDLPRSKKQERPTEKAPVLELSTLDGNVPITGLSNPQDATDAIARQANEYMMDVFLKEVLPDYKPDLSIVWFREPDTTGHKYGPGTKPFYKALANQDKLLGKMLLYLDKLGLSRDTNILIVSDHGNSNVSADTDNFPLREIKNGSIGEINKNGYSVSGIVRVADLLTKAGFKAYDGRGCNYNPVLHGMLEDRKLLAPIFVDQNGEVCKEGPGRLYTTKSYFVPDVLPNDAIVVASNGGSVFLYLAEKNQKLAEEVVRFLQSRLEFDAVFIDSKYGDLPGTLPLRKVKFYDENDGRHPDILVSMSYNAEQKVQGLPGVVYSTSTGVNRGSHGTLSPKDIQNVFIAFGPDFKSNYVNVLPTANVDVPMTMAYILNLPFEDRTGRPILESIKGSGVKASDYELTFLKVQPKKPATNLKIRSPRSLESNEVIANKDSYTFVLNTKQLDYQGQKYNYIDSGKAVRY